MVMMKVAKLVRMHLDLENFNWIVWTTKGCTASKGHLYKLLGSPVKISCHVMSAYFVAVINFIYRAFSLLKFHDVLSSLDADRVTVFLSSTSRNEKVGQGLDFIE